MKSPARIALAALVLAALCCAVGFAKLRYALTDDQTLFLHGAEVIRNGGVLYRDLWDIKPPGIFFVYFAGARLCGFTDVGVRLFELLILIGFALVTFLWLRRWIGPRAAWLGGLLTVVFYYGLTNASDLGTVEGLSCLPMAVAAFGLLAPRSKWRLILAGMCVGFLILLKLFYGLLGAAFWLVFLIADRDASRRVSKWAVLLASAAAPIIATLAWFAWRGALPDLITAVFIVPYEARFATDPMKRLGILRSGFQHFWDVTLPLRILLIPAAWAAYRNRRDRKAMTVLAYLGVWIAAGTVAILVQLQSWWRYHWLLILPAVALIAAYGLDWTLTQIGRAAPPAHRALAALLLVAVLWTGRSVVRTAADDLWTGKGAVEPAQYRRQRQYDARQVKCTPSDTALVWMSPMTYRFSGCRPASAVDGTQMIVLPPSVLARARADIQRSSPRYIYLNRRDIQRFAAALPGVLDPYEIQYQSELGSWYRLKQSLPLGS